MADISYTDHMKAAEEYLMTNAGAMATTIESLSAYDRVITVATLNGVMGDEGVEIIPAEALHAFAELSAVYPGAVISPQGGHAFIISIYKDRAGLEKAAIQKRGTSTYYAEINANKG